MNLVRASFPSPSNFLYHRSFSRAHSFQSVHRVIWRLNDSEINALAQSSRKRTFGPLVYSISISIEMHISLAVFVNLME